MSLWTVVDETGAPATVAAFYTEAAAHLMLEAWRHRNPGLPEDFHVSRVQ